VCESMLDFQIGSVNNEQTSVNLFNKLIITHRQQRGIALISPSTTIHFYVRLTREIILYKKKLYNFI